MRCELAEIGREQGALRVVTARLAARALDAKVYERLGYVRASDYAVERLGVSAAFVRELARMDGALAELPGLAAALTAGEIGWAKARLVARVAGPEDEARWIALARKLDVVGLSRETRRVDLGSLEAGAAALEEPRDEEGRRIEFREGVTLGCSLPVRALWSDARRAASRVSGRELEVWEAMERVSAEVGSALPLDAEAVAELEQGPGVAELAPVVVRRRARRGSWRAAYAQREKERKERMAGDGALPGSTHDPERSTLPPHLAKLVDGLDAADPFSIDSRLREALALGQRAEARIAPLLLAVRNRKLYRDEGFRSVAAYAQERLGISPTKTGALLGLARTGAAAPELAEAFEAGRLTWTQALALSPLLRSGGGGAKRDADARRRWVAWAARVSVRRLRQDVDAAQLAREADPVRALPLPPEDAARSAQPDPAGHQTGDEPRDAEETPLYPEKVRLAWSAPRDAARSFCATLCTVRRALERRIGRLPTQGEALGAMLDHALAAWGIEGERYTRAHPILARDGWRCVVPGCSSQTNLQVHHVVFRSRGGDDAPENLLTLCAAHHLQGVHGRNGSLRITGSAPDALVFELGLRAGKPPVETWRSGDVRSS